MSIESAISLACLLITGSIAAWGIFSHHFDDTVLQRIGMSIVATGCFTRALERIHHHIPEPPPALLWSQIGLAIYAVGTAIRLWVASRKQPERRSEPGRRGVNA